MSVFVLDKATLARLAAACREAEAQGGDDPTLTLRTFTVRALIRQASFGRGLATIQAKPFKQLSAAGRKAANARWNRARAQRDGMDTQDCATREHEKTNT